MTSLNKQETKTPKISKKEYIQYTKNLRDILGVTIPAQTEVTRDFVKNSALAKALQYTPEQFIADERENANIAKISAIFILEQAEQNENTKELSGIEDTTIIKHTPLIIEKRTIEETTIETTPHLIKRKVTEMKIEEESKTHKEVEKIDHEDLAILERSIKNLTFSISKDNEEKFNAALTGIDQLIKKYTSKRSYKAFRKQYNNTTTHALSLQKIVVDIKKEPGRKTLLQELLDEVRKKNK